MACDSKKVAETTANSTNIAAASRRPTYEADDITADGFASAPLVGAPGVEPAHYVLVEQRVHISNYATFVLRARLVPVQMQKRLYCQPRSFFAYRLSARCVVALGVVANLARAVSRAGFW